MVHTSNMLASPATDTAIAIGTSAAAGIALATLAFLCYQWAKDRRERRRLEEQKQAARMNCWFTQTSARFSEPADEPLYRITGKLEWLNRSDDPVYSVLILGHLATIEVGGFPLLKARELIGSSVHIPVPVIAPGGNETQEWTWSFDTDHISTLTKEFILSWQFNDACGVTWLKNSRGYMAKVRPSPKAKDTMVASMLPVVEGLRRQVSDIVSEAQAKVDEAEESIKKSTVQDDADSADKPHD